MDRAFRQFFASIGKNLPFLLEEGREGGLRAGLKLMLIIDDILRFSKATRIYHVYEKFSKYYDHHCTYCRKALHLRYSKAVEFVSLIYVPKTLMM